ncbi:MAG: hypothetical protein JXP34_08705, partial [Planctomycetes bacterium]|nr:hypothetical protein [Planctomycetota bacterium]
MMLAWILIASVPSAATPSIVDAYNQACADADAEHWDDAIRRFEDAAVTAEPPVSAMARYNLGWCRFHKGEEAWREAEAVPEADAKQGPAGGGGKEKIEALAKAAAEFAAARAFFEEVRPRDDDVRRNIDAAKAAARAVLDRIAAIQEKAREEEEAEALKNPPELLDAIREREKLHRALARGMADLGQEEMRSGARRLRKSEAENRALAEKLAAALAAFPGPGDPKEPPKEEVDLRHEAAKIVGEAAAAQREVEVALIELDATAAAAAAGKAIEKLREARARFPFDPAALVAQLIPIQEGVIGATEALPASQEPGERKGSETDSTEASESGAAKAAPEPDAKGAGARILDTLKDKVLAPLAKALTPRDTETGSALAEEEHEVVWGASILEMIDPDQAAAQAAAQGQGPALPGAPPPAPDEAAHAKAKEIFEKVHDHAVEARAQATKARDALAAGDLAASLEPQRKALAALREIEALLPKPPKSPVERLKELLARQEAAEDAIGALEKLDADTRKDAIGALAESQTADGREAGEIAGDLEAMASQQPPAKEAAKLVRDAEGEIHTSSESIRKNDAKGAGEAVERGIDAIRKALDLLSGKQPEKQGPREDRKKDGGGAQKKDATAKKERGAYALSQRDARLMRQKMDQEREEKEAKIGM